MLFHDSICFDADSAVRAVDLTPQPQCVSVSMSVTGCVFERVCVCAYTSRLILSHSCAMLTLQHLLMGHVHVPQSCYQHHTPCCGQVLITLPVQSSSQHPPLHTQGIIVNNVGRT